MDICPRTSTAFARGLSSYLDVSSPVGMDMTTTNMNDIIVNVNVIGSFDASIDLTLTPYDSDVPMSPKKNEPSQEKYRTKKGLVRPICSRSAESASGVALIPSLAVAASPGISSNDTNTNKVTSSIVTAKVISFLITVFMYILLIL